jgi:hypothetical protein
MESAPLRSEQGRHTSTPPYVCMAWCLIKHRAICLMSVANHSLILCLQPIGVVKVWNMKSWREEHGERRIPRKYEVTALRLCI